MKKITKRTGFNFGLEAEYLLVDRNTYRPLWHHDLQFQKLNQILESISLEDIPELDGLELETPHNKLMPYAVEGYGVVDEEFKPFDLLPKGIEIRTPIASSLDDCLSHFCLLHSRMQSALANAGYLATALSHHPVEYEFTGPVNKRRHDWWQWAMEVMVTYGPDFNISLPTELTSRLDLPDLDAKVNYYAPAMTAFSVASPFSRGELWKIRGENGKSLRTYRRSIVAPAIEVHLDEGGRLEFKTFEMSWRLDDFRNYFLLWLTLLLDQGLTGRASRQSCVYDLGAVARNGLHAETIKERAAELLESAPATLKSFGFDSSSLLTLEKRLDSGFTPADEIIEMYQENKSLPGVLQNLSHLC